MPTNNSKKLLYRSSERTYFNATGPLYNRNCQNYVAFHLSISLSARHFRGHSFGKNSVKPCKEDDISRIEFAPILLMFATGLFIHSQIERFTTLRQTRCIKSRGNCDTIPIERFLSGGANAVFFINHLVKLDVGS